ncbi:MAG: hypothetical protein B7Y25_08375 [Alphaproteobacteria bacterium 16-39-46]|nr:MAG: hypothetical protein B7Y25_08375 [Alphaproteobacteria bacterium 16-39-46]OZA41106.1 MAG: hypothetical protein B7X84_08565 [Alphaproteobacteria bacterium 17-39-52]
MLIKAELSRKISDIICQRHLTQKKVAELLRIDQTKIFLLLRGKLIGFSIERLFRFLVLRAINCQTKIF